MAKKAAAHADNFWPKYTPHKGGGNTFRGSPSRASSLRCFSRRENPAAIRFAPHLDLESDVGGIRLCVEVASRAGRALTQRIRFEVIFCAQNVPPEETYCAFNITLRYQAEVCLPLLARTIPTNLRDDPLVLAMGRRAGRCFKT